MIHSRGLVCQWPLGWLADHMSRVRLIRLGGLERSLQRNPTPWR